MHFSVSLEMVFFLIKIVHGVTLRVCNTFLFIAWLMRIPRIRNCIYTCIRHVKATEFYSLEIAGSFFRVVQIRGGDIFFCIEGDTPGNIIVKTM